MKVLITGGAGFIGKKLAATLLARQPHNVESVTVFDVAAGELPGDPRLVIKTGSIVDDRVIGELVAERHDLVFHLAAIVSANAEADFDLGWSVNWDGTRCLLEAIRAQRHTPRFIFASSLAVYGGEMPVRIPDSLHLTPQTSYGAQKAACELLAGDFHRKGFIDGCSLRLPTIVVRPGRPNKAASTFASSIVREPLAGEQAICPVSADSAMYVLSPRRVVQAMLHAASLSPEEIGPNRSIQLPGIKARIGDVVDTLRHVAGDKAAERVIWQPNPTIQKIVSGWASDCEPHRALKLGFEADDSIESIILAHIEDELGGIVK